MTTAADRAREFARQRDGKFGEQTHTDPEVALEPEVWQLDVKYGNGRTQTFLLNGDGELLEPVKSDQLTLVSLTGFRLNPFDRAGVTLEAAFAAPALVLNMAPTFDTWEGVTALLAVTTHFGPKH